MKALALALAIGAAGTAAAGEKLREQDRVWLAQVEFLISKAERSAFEKTAPAQREQFIDDFWASRDPDPSTPQNELREEHIRRIRYADQNFTEGTTPGWSTPRGRTLLRWGPPDRRDQLMADPHTVTQERGAMLSRMVKLMYDVWIYERPPAVSRRGLVRRIIFEPDVEHNRYRAIADEVLPPAAANRWP